uniref:beta strand repeat-containing protein n=2 Tax=unclassified Empedobacter TaxID=2643773 RepID=UPI0025C689BE
MRKLYLFFWLWFIITIVVNAQSSTETFETESVGSINFTDNGVVFNIISHKGTFNIYRSNGWGWSGTSADNQFIDNNTLPTANASFSIKTTSNLFRMNRFWIYLSDVNDNQSITGTLTITGKLNSVTKFTQTKITGFANSSGNTNGYTLIDLTNLNGQNYSNIVIDELVITAGGDYAYMGFDAFTWEKYSNQPTVTTDATVTNLGAKTVTVGGSNTDDGTTISARGIVWSTTANPVLNGPGVTNVAATTNGSGAFTINATSLPAATTLYYRAYATNAAGTAYGDVKSFTTNPALSATQSQTIACNGVNNGKATVVPSGGKSPYTYSWSPSGGNGATATGLSPNNYTVTITDNEGTFITKTFTIAQNPAIITGFTITDVSYYGGNNGAINISPLGGSGSYTYNWGGGITTQNRSNLTAGTYSVTITDDNGCTFTINNLQVTQPASIPAVVSSITRRSTNPTNANTVEYNVEFSKDVTGVSNDDFTLTSIGNTIGSISNVTGSGTTYTVTITGLSGDGTIRLDLNNGTGIKDADNNAVSGFTSGEIYTIDHTAPSVTGVTNGGIYNTNRTISFNEGKATLNGSSFSSGSVVSSEGSYILVVTDNAGNMTTVSFSIDKTPPAIPANFKAVGGDTKITLTWDANTESDLKEYQLYVIPEGGAKVLLATLLKGTNSYLHTSLSNGITYSYFLSAEDKAGNSSEKATVAAKAMGEQTITFGSLSSMTYGDSDKTLTATAGSGLPVSYVSSNPAIASIYQDAADGNKWKVRAHSAGAVTITATQLGDNQYLPAKPISQSLTVEKAALTVTADSKSKVYGSTDPSLTYQITSAKLIGTDQLTGGLARDAGENVGNYPITERALKTETEYIFAYKR